MQLTLFIAKVFSVAFVVAGISLVLYKRSFRRLTADFSNEPLPRIGFAFIEMLAGLLIVFSHNIWTPLPAAFITALGWLAVFEGAAYLLLPLPVIDRFLSLVNRPITFVAGGVAAIISGIYLGLYGFGFLPLG